MRDGAWAGEPAYLVGGGPSLRGFDWGILRDRKHVLVINAAIFNVPTAEIFFTEDLRFIQRYATRDGWNEFQGIKVFAAPERNLGDEALKADPSIVVIHRTRDDKYWSPSLREGLSRSSNSGIGALNLADILGADPIYLLGFDCRKRRPGEPANYHELYPQDWRMPLGQEDSYRSDFEHWAAMHLRHRAVINLVDPDFPSAIRCWPMWHRDKWLMHGNRQVVRTEA